MTKRQPAKFYNDHHGPISSNTTTHPPHQRPEYLSNSKKIPSTQRSFRTIKRIVPNIVQVLSDDLGRVAQLLAHLVLLGEQQRHRLLPVDPVVQEQEVGDRRGAGRGRRGRARQPGTRGLGRGRADLDVRFAAGPLRPGARAAALLLLWLLMLQLVGAAWPHAQGEEGLGPALLGRRCLGQLLDLVQELAELRAFEGLERVNGWAVGCALVEDAFSGREGSPPEKRPCDPHGNSYPIDTGYFHFEESLREFF